LCRLPGCKDTHNICVSIISSTTFLFLKLKGDAEQCRASREASLDGCFSHMCETEENGNIHLSPSLKTTLSKLWMGKELVEKYKHARVEKDVRVLVLSHTTLN
jgi:hypothetical protein